MTVLFVMIPATFVLAALAVWAFTGAVRSGQFDDLDTPGVRIIAEDDQSHD